VLLLAVVCGWPARYVAGQEAEARGVVAAALGRRSDSAATPLAATALAAPRTIQVFLVAVPDVLQPDRPVSYTVTPTGGARIIPPLRGVVPASGLGGEGSPRTVMVAASVPAGALAGVRTIAAVQFSQGDVSVPVRLDLQVSQTRSAGLRLGQQLFGVQPGDRVVIQYFLTNTGNASDTLDVVVIPPPHWGTDGTPRRYVLGAGEAASGNATVTVPRVAVSGVFRATVSASSGTRRVAGADAVIELLETPGGRAALGPKVAVGMVSVLDDSGLASPVLGLEIAGPVTDEIQAFGRLVQATDPGAVDQRGLARVGYFVGAPFLTLAAPRWQFTGGTTGRSFSDVTGVSAYGRGVSFNWSGAPLSIAALAAAPVSVAPGANGRVLGVRVGGQVWRPGAQVNATLTDFEDPQIADRRLQAIGIGAVSPAFSGVTASGELAQRWFAGGDGLGWLTEFKRQGRGDFGQVRVAHAPGGSAAFAHARDELSMAASRQFGKRLSIGGSFWTSDDENPTFSRLHTFGWTLTPRYDLSQHTSLDLQAQANSFEANSSAGLLGNGGTVVRLGVKTQHGTAFLSGTATLGSASQTAGIPGGPAIATSAGRQSLSVAGGTAMDRGTLELSWSFEHSGVGVGLLPYATVVSLRAGRVAVASTARSPVVNAEVQYYGWFGDRPSVAVARLGVLAPLPGNLALTVDIERNPFITGLVGSARWIAVVKLERSMHLPVGALRPAAKGEVFEDRNVNGVRDAGELAVAGAVVRRGTETVITDRSGRFRFYDKTAVPVRLDETSLPFGVIANTAAALGRQPLGGIEIGVIPTAAVDVRLVPTADSSGRLPHVELTGIPLQAIDTTGSAWTTRADSAGRARFDALPPGRYRLQVDFSGLREHVRLRGPAPVFTVEPSRAVPPLTVPVYPRPIRMFDPGSPGQRGSHEGPGR
jgi:hypothetical protein